MDVFNDRLESKYYLATDEIEGEKCRTCLRRTTEIWQVFQGDSQISEKIMACASVQVHEGDGLPPVICYSCRDLLDVSYTFKCQVEKSDANLRDALKLSPMYPSNSLNTVITEAITDEIASKQSPSTMASPCGDRYQTEYLDHQIDSDITFDQSSQSSDKKILDFVENREIFDHLKSAQITRLEPADQTDRDISERPVYLELTKSTEEPPVIQHLQTSGTPDIDDQKIKEKAKIGRHKIGKKSKFRYVCYMCEKQFTTIERLKDHIGTDHEITEKTVTNVDVQEVQEGDNLDKKKNKFACDYCTKQFTYEKSFLTHAKRHPEYKKLEKIETECNEPRLNDSEDDDVDLGDLQCTQCGKLFATKRNLKRHISTHSGLKFNCPTCHKEFSRADKLKEHEQAKHGDEFFGEDDERDSDSDAEKTGDGESRKKDKNNKPHQCPLCPRSFVHNSTLLNHVERHKRKQPQKRFLCEVCSKCFAQSGSLVAHMRTHTGVKPYVCKVCSRAFTKSTYLQLHLRTHSGEKPYICQYCSRAFARANTLARHITMHTGEAKYHCQICMKSFRRLTSLNEHTYTHTGQRPYACKICTKRYNNAGSLYAHTKKCKAQQSSAPISTFQSTIEENPDDPPPADPTPLILYTGKKYDPPVDSTIQEFILPNVPGHKPLSPTMIPPGTEENLYSVNTKQFKNFYYTTYPSL